MANRHLKFNMSKPDFPAHLPNSALSSFFPISIKITSLNSLLKLNTLVPFLTPPYLSTSLSFPCSQSHIQSISKCDCLLLRNTVSHPLHCYYPSPSHQHIFFSIIGIKSIPASLPSLSCKSIYHTAA